jgi:hypothetical protein
VVGCSHTLHLVEDLVSTLLSSAACFQSVWNSTACTALCKYNTMRPTSLSAWMTGCGCGFGPNTLSAASRHHCIRICASAPSRTLSATRAVSTLKARKAMTAALVSWRPTCRPLSLPLRVAVQF